MILPNYGSGGNLSLWNHRHLSTVARKRLSSRAVMFPLPKPNPNGISHHKVTKLQSIKKVFSFVPLRFCGLSLRVKQSNLQRANFVAGAAA